MSNGIGKNPLLDISKVYLEQIVEKKDDSYLEPDMKKRQKNNEKARKDLMKGPQMKNPYFEDYDPMDDPDFDHDEAEKNRGVSGKNNPKGGKAFGKKIVKKKVKEALDPVGQEDDDIDNDGKKNTKSDKYLGKRRKAIAKAMKKRMKEEVENVEELYKGKHGQTDKQYADSRSQGGKMVSGDSKMSGAEYTHGRRVKAANPGMQPDVGGKTKPKSQGKMDKGTRADLKYRKANLKKEELEASGLFTEEEINAILKADEQFDEAMSSYDRNRKRAAQRAAARNAARDAGKTGVVPGVGYVTPRRERETYTDEKGTVRHKSGAKMP